MRRKALINKSIEIPIGGLEMSRIGLIGGLFDLIETCLSRQ